MKILVDWDVQGPKSGSFHIDPEDFDGLTEDQMESQLQDFVEEHVQYRLLPGATYPESVIEKIKTCLEAIENVG